MSDGSTGSNEKYNRGGLIAFMFSMAFVCLFFIYIVLIHPGIQLDEKVVDPNAKDASGKAIIAFDASKVPEPWVTSPDMIAHGKKVFQTNCAICHGNEGKGDGPSGMGLNPKPRNLVEGKWTQGEGAISHYKVLQNGIPGGSMASFKHFKKADRWALIHFIDSITNNKSKDDPAKVAEFAKTAD